nr:pectate lyase [Armatimonas sp.]
MITTISTPSSTIWRGLDFVFSAELPVGGFPQFWPSPKGYAGHITFNDGVTVGNLSLLKDVADSQTHWAWLDTARRDKARKAVARGVTCILKCQIKQTGWCQQHDEKTFEATTARTFELASVCPQDTVEILRFLMRFEKPGSGIAGAITNGVTWLARVKLSGIRVEKIKAPPEKFEFHDTDTDVIVVKDPIAPPLWARHYEIGTNRPIFAGRDAVKRYTLAAIERERRTGTPWYGTWPAMLLKKDYPEWQKRPRA